MSALMNKQFLHHIGQINQLFKTVGSTPVKAGRWQARDVSHSDAHDMHEVLHYSLQMLMEGEGLELYRRVIEPNIPWADDHFAERVCGEPINPGKEWANWPPGRSMVKDSMSQEQFNHNYMERYWPKLAGLTPQGKVYGELGQMMHQPHPPYDFYQPHRGIRHEYGDLGNVVNLLQKEPMTRQAYLPVWFPEDTGDVHDGRKPCTIGYWFIVRNDKMDVQYHIRSCDYIRHFRDDVYLTVRLVLWILEQLRVRDERWNNVAPGQFIMHIGNLHMFAHDYKRLTTRGEL